MPGLYLEMGLLSPLGSPTLLKPLQAELGGLSEVSAFDQISLF